MTENESTLAVLTSVVTDMRTAIVDNARKLDGIVNMYATKAELAALEARLGREVGQLRDQVEKDHDRRTLPWTQIVQTVCTVITLVILVAGLIFVTH